jgi:hypothetical protein
MEQKLPDAVSVFNGVGGRGFGVHVSQYLEHGIAVPGTSLKGAAELVSEAERFSHGKLR